MITWQQQQQQGVTVSPPPTMPGHAHMTGVGGVVASQFDHHPQHRQIFQQQQNQAQMEQLASQMGHMSVQQPSAQQHQHQQQQQQHLDQEMNMSGGGGGGILLQSDPDSVQRRTDPVYASMASHGVNMSSSSSSTSSSSGASSEVSSVASSYNEDFVVHHGSCILKRPDVFPRCLHQWY